MTEYNGKFGKIVLDPEKGTLTLIRNGKDSRVIELSTISGVRLEPATHMLGGYLILAFDGADAPDVGRFAGQMSDNAVTFLRNRQETFEELHEQLKEIVANNQLIGFAAVLTEPVEEEPVLSAPVQNERLQKAVRTSGSGMSGAS